MFNILNLEAGEAERLAYANGQADNSALFARIAELEAERDALQFELDDLPTRAELDRQALDLEALKEFFYDCFERLAGHYPCPEWGSYYDKSIIFNAIERGEGG